MDWCDSNTEAIKKRIKRQATDLSSLTGSRSVAFFRFFGAYVAFASFVCHSLMVLVIAFS